METLQAFFISKGQEVFTHDEVNKWLDGCFFVEVTRYISIVCIEVDNSLAILTEDIDVVIANELMNFHIGPIFGTQSQGTIEHEFHVTGT